MSTETKTKLIKCLKWPFRPGQTLDIKVQVYSNLKFTLKVVLVSFLKQPFVRVCDCNVCLWIEICFLYHDTLGMSNTHLLML